MTNHTAPPVADDPQSGDDIAPDLSALMERMERVRKFMLVEREYIKLVLIGMWFVLFGAILTPGFPWRAFLVLGMAATPWLFGWYNLPRLRLANAFRNETLPFLLRDYGRWNYALAGTHFSRDALKRTGFLYPTDAIGVHSIITGERYGVPVQFAVLSSWPHPRFGIYRGRKANFSGWGANIRLPDLPQAQFLVLPSGQAPRDPACKSWISAPLTPSHTLFSPRQDGTALPPKLLARLMQIMVETPQSAFAVHDGILWVFATGSDTRFNEGGTLYSPLNEPAPYERVRGQLAEIFKVIDRLVWPST
jgi:hypothetical protein